MLYKLLEELAKISNVREHRGEKLFKDAMDLAHNEKARAAIWWYRLSDGKLEYSETAVTHQDPKAFSAASGCLGWVRGRVLKQDDKAYIVIYTEPWPAKEVPGSTVVDIFNKITGKASIAIDGIVDEDGFDLLET